MHHLESCSWISLCPLPAPFCYPSTGQKQCIKKITRKHPPSLRSHTSQITNTKMDTVKLKTQAKSQTKCKLQTTQKGGSSERLKCRTHSDGSPLVQERWTYLMTTQHTESQLDSPGVGKSKWSSTRDIDMKTQNTRCRPLCSLLHFSQITISTIS